MDKIIVVADGKKHPLGVFHLVEDVVMDLKVRNHHETRHQVSVRQVALAINQQPVGAPLRQQLEAIHELLCANPTSRIAQGDDLAKVKALMVKPRTSVLAIDVLEDSVPRFKYNPVPHPDEVRTVTDGTSDETDEERERRRLKSWEPQ